MSDYLPVTTAMEDCIQLMLTSDGICPAFKEALGDRLPFAMFGALIRPADVRAVQRLEQYRDDWPSHRTAKAEIGFRSAPLVPKTQAESVLSLVLGSLCHEAIAHVLQPVSEEAALYQSAYMFRQYYMRESGAAAEASEAVDRQQLAALFAALQQRFFIEMHTFVPDVDDIEGWFDKLYAGIRAYDEAQERLADAIAQPEADKVQKYIEAPGFYRADEAIVQLALAVRSGETPTREKLEAALAEEAGSRYGQALRQGCDRLARANAFFSNRLDAQQLTAI